MPDYQELISFIEEYLSKPYYASNHKEFMTNLISTVQDENTRTRFEKELKKQIENDDKEDPCINCGKSGFEKISDSLTGCTSCLAKCGRCEKIFYYTDGTLMDCCQDWKCNDCLATLAVYETKQGQIICGNYNPKTELHE